MRDGCRARRGVANPEAAGCGAGRKGRKREAHGTFSRWESQAWGVSMLRGAPPFMRVSPDGRQARCPLSRRAIFFPVGKAEGAMEAKSFDLSKKSHIPKWMRGFESGMRRVFRSER